MHPRRTVPRRPLSGTRTATGRPATGRTTRLRRLGIACALAATLPSPAGQSAAAAAPPPSRNGFFVQQLRKDPLYVSPSLSRVAPASQVDALRREMAAAPFPVYVVLAPSFPHEPGRASGEPSTAILHDRLGRDGVYVIAHQGGAAFEAGAYGVETKGRTARAGGVAYDGTTRRDTPVTRLRVGLRYLRTGVVPPTRREPTRSYGEDDGISPWLVFLGALAVGGLLPALILAARPSALRRRRARRQAARPLAALDRGEARRDAQERTAGLARAIAEAQDPPDAAVRCHDAASSVLSRGKASATDYVGAAALARAGRASIDGKVWKPCFFDPRHGEGVHPTRWRQGAADVPIPTCKACAKAIAGGRQPRGLPDDGRPYWERDSVWARTGFGAIDDDVADLVLAGGRKVRR